MKRSQDALILQGGGALGAYEAGAIRRLMEWPAFRPAVITGVSIGAINAAVLVGARRDPVESLLKMWEEFAVKAVGGIPKAMEPYLSLWGNQSFYRMRFDYASLPLWTNLYDTTPLKEVLARYIDFDKLNQSPIRLAITAANVEKGEIEVFDNHGPGQEIRLEHVLASGSLPPGFPMQQIGDAHYWDGGLFDNTPLMPAIERLDPGPKLLKRLFVVKLFPRQGPVPANMLQVYDRILEMVFAGNLARDVHQAERVNEFVEAFQRMDELLGQLPDQKEVKSVRKLPGYQRLQQYMALQDIICIENEAPEIASAPFDFSRQRIRKRLTAGYEDAGKALEAIGAEAPVGA